MNNLSTSNSSIYRFIFKTISFLILLILMDRSFIVFREGENNLFGVIADEKMTRVIPRLNKEKSPDIMFVGSSHAQFAISPEVISHSLHVSSINVAYGGGANMGLQFALLKKLLTDKTMKPKVIVFAIDVFALNPPPMYSDIPQDILFKHKDHIWNNYEKYFYSGFKLYSRNIPSYLYNAKHGQWKLPYFKEVPYDLSMFSKYKKYEITDSGWVKGYGTLNKEYVRYSALSFNPDSRSIELLESYVNLCRMNNIKLIFIQVPEHSVSLKFSKKYMLFDKWIRQVSVNNNLQYFDYNSKAAFPVDNDFLYFDSDHLNFKGAELFSHLLSKDLSYLLNNNSIIASNNKTVAHSTNPDSSVDTTKA